MPLNDWTKNVIIQTAERGKFAATGRKLTASQKKSLVDAAKARSMKKSLSRETVFLWASKVDMAIVRNDKKAIADLLKVRAGGTVAIWDTTNDNCPCPACW